MNNVSLIGRLVRDPEMRYTTSGTAIASFTLAVDRKFDRSKTDFINCKAWQKTAEFVGEYFKKGNKVGITGRIETGSYEKDGRTIYTTDVIAENAEFVESRKAAEESAKTADLGKEIEVDDAFLDDIFGKVGD